MRLHIGLVLGTIAIVFVLAAIPTTWYSVHVVGTNFAALSGMEPTRDDDYRELQGEWSLRNYVIYNQTWEAPPEEFCEPMTVMPITEPVDPDEPAPNENAVEVVRGTTVAVGAAVAALGLGAFGAWNIARYDRFRLFTAASFILAGMLLIGACAYFSASFNGAMADDAGTGLEDTFGLAFEPYLDPDRGDPGYYSEFSGGYPDQDAGDLEQLSFGPGSGWWLAGTGGVLAVITGLVLVAAPQYHPLIRRRPKVVEVTRHVPVPSVASLRDRRL